jgi:ribosomal protein L16 Arg81 hydroxylase
VTFNDLIAPLTVSDFLHRYLGKNFLFTHVRDDAWQPPLNWRELNAAIGSLRVAGERLRIVKSGKDVDPDVYLHHAGARDGSMVNAGMVAALLADGATLVINQADELVTGVGRLVESCERVFRIPIGANLYAGWCTTKGFDLHWDDHDTLIVQAIGRKHWTVYAPTREHPIRSDKTGSAPKPTASPVLDCLLNEGDVLYMPRGWWHVARPIDEASVHLTLGMSHPTGLDLMKWLMETMLEHVEIRQGIPHLLNQDEQARHVAALREHVVRALSDDVLGRFMDRLEEKDSKRVPLELPIAVEGSPLDAGTRMRLARTKRIRPIANESGFAAFHVHDAPWECHPRLAPALALLDPYEPRSLDELMQVTPPELRPVLKAMLLALRKAGAVVLESDPACREAESRETESRETESCEVGEPSSMSAASA